MLDHSRLRNELSLIHQSLAQFTGRDGNDLVHHLRTVTKLERPPKMLIWQALHSDCMRVAYTAVAADGDVSDAEIDELYEYLFTVARHYASVVEGYREFRALDDTSSARSFLDCYESDRGPFGYRAPDTTRWLGLELCRRAAQLGEQGALERYERMASWFTEEAMHVGHVTDSDSRWRSRLAQIEELRRALAAGARVRGPTGDLRAHAFMTGRRVFAGIALASSVFDDDPFDVEAVHAQPREVFARLVDRAITPSAQLDHGRMLLVLGDAGAGKTHLLRAFRRHVHDKGLGLVAYAQLQSRSSEYARYLLNHVVDSLDKPYAGPPNDRSGLYELASGLPRLVGEPLRGRIAKLTDDWPDTQTLNQYVNGLVDELLLHEDLAGFDPDLFRAMLYVLRQEPRTTARVSKYLRCEDMNTHDRRWIGDVVPRTDADAPIRMIQWLARLAFATQGAALVLMVDQAELAGFSEESPRSFSRAIDALYQIVDNVPSAVAVVACLEDLWLKVGQDLTRASRDRLEMDPPLERLVIARSYDDIEAIVSKRLAWLYADAGAEHRSAEPTYPIPVEHLRSLTNRRTRDVLDTCQRFQDQCARIGRIDDAWEGWRPSNGPRPKADQDLDRIASAWNDFLHTSSHEIPSEDDALERLLADAAEACSIENEALQVELTRHEMGLSLDLRNGPLHRALAVGLTNRSYRGGGFGAQVDSVRKLAGTTRTPVIVRTSEFPSGKVSAEKIATLLRDGGRSHQLGSSDLRSLVAMRAFQTQHHADVLRRWRCRDRPITGRSTIAALFELDVLLAVSGAADETVRPHSSTASESAPPSTDGSVPPPTATSASSPAAASHSSATPSGSRGHLAAADSSTNASAGAIHVGTSMGFRREPVSLSHATLLRHSGVLGSTGSGKTTLALNLLEQLLEHRVPVLLVDRKGDLAGYARSEWWNNIDDSERKQRAAALARLADVRLFTPGTRGGRPLAFGVVPELEGVPEHERGRLVQHAASALAAMMRLGEGSQDAARRAILAQAITVLAERRAPASLEELLVMLESRDDDLLARVGRYDDKLFKKLITDLETLRLNDGELFDPDAEQLSADALLGVRNGMVPLSIVSTKFLGDNAKVQAWVAHLLVELSRWCMRNPRDVLQAIVMLDEADLYMPAGTSKPPSKEPLQDLLKRARSGGLGVMLATQSPGDLDYRSREQINSWFVGRVGENRSIEKLKPLFERKPSAAGKLGDLRAGQFIVIQGATVLEVERAPSLLITDQLPETEIVALAAGCRLA